MRCVIACLVICAMRSAIAAPCAAPSLAPGKDRLAQLAQAWRAAIGSGTGTTALDVVDGLAIVRRQGGTSLAIDVATGGVCATLAEQSKPGIDHYTARSAVAHGLLVGGNKHDLVGVELRTGAVRWQRRVLDPADHDDYTLRDALQVATVPGAIVVAFPLRHRDG